MIIIYLEMFQDELMLVEARGESSRYGLVPSKPFSS